MRAFLYVAEVAGALREGCPLMASHWGRWAEPASFHRAGADADRGSSVEDVDTESIRLVGSALVSLFDAAWLRWQPPQADSAVSAAGRGISGHAWPLGENGQRCPDSTAPLEVSDAEIAADSHMATLFVNDAVPQCLLWALHRRSLLHYTVKDGELPGVRCPSSHLRLPRPPVLTQSPPRSPRHARIAMLRSATRTGRSPSTGSCTDR